MSEQVFVPAPTDWFSCTLKWINVKGGFANGELDNGELVWVHAHDTVAPGQHFLCLPKGTSMLVRMKRKDTLISQYQAIECVVNGGFKSQREVGVVKIWRNGCFGTARRPCGCELLIKTDGNAAEKLIDLERGDTVEFDTVWSTHKKRHIGVNIRKLGNDLFRRDTRRGKNRPNKITQASAPKSANNDCFTDPLARHNERGPAGREVVVGSKGRTSC